MTIICRYCEAENKENARYCVNCGNDITEAKTNDGTVLKPLQISTVIMNYQVLGITYNSSERNRYDVVDISPEDQRVAICADPNCGAYHQPWSGSGADKFCTQCGKPLSANNLILNMIEHTTPPNEAVQEIIQRSITHGFLCVPLRVFQQNRAFYMVTPKFGGLPEVIEVDQLLKDSIGLAQGLDILHQTGISFDGQLGKNQLGFFNNHLAWVQFDSCSVSNQRVLPDAMRKDVIGLAQFLYRAITNQKEYTPQTGFSQQMNELFRCVLQEQSIATAAAFSQAMEAALAQQASTISIELQLGQISHVGMVRELNEDSLMVLSLNMARQSRNQPRGVFAVADGMGGHAAGEVASGLIVETLMQEAARSLVPGWASNQTIDVQKWVTNSVLTANKAVYDRGKGAGNDMGSTLVLAVFDSATVYIAHVGDSRIYLVTPDSIQQLTTDHSLVERLVASGQITREQARTHDKKNVIYRTIGDKPNLEVDTAVHTLSPGDFLLLCSDGLSGMVEDQYLFQILNNASSPQKACEELIKAANAAGGEDNVTAIVVKVVATSK